MKAQGSRSRVASGVIVWVVAALSWTACSTAPAKPAAAAPAPASTAPTAETSVAKKDVHAPVATPEKRPTPLSTVKGPRKAVPAGSETASDDGEEALEKATADKKPQVGPRRVKPDTKPAPTAKPVPQGGHESTAVSKSPGYASLPKALQEVEAKYAESHTLFAEFNQTNETAATGAKKQSKGIIYAKRQGKIRWETRSPDANLLVSNGRKFWFYTPPFDESEHGQVVERPANQVQTKLANALLSGSFSVLNEMKIEEKGATKFVLYPKKGVAGSVSRAEIEIDPKRHLIKTVILEHEGGNRSEIHLSQIELGRKMGDELFNFVPPPNTDHINP